LCQHIPLSWVEQRSQFGLPPAPSQRRSLISSCNKS
jgi:hypothetical protein